MSAAMQPHVRSACSSLAELAHLGRRPLNAPLDNLGVAFGSLAGLRIISVEAIHGTPAESAVSLSRYIVKQAALGDPRVTTARGVAFYTLPDLRRAICHGGKLDCHFSGMSGTTWTRDEQIGWDVARALCLWRVGFDWSGKYDDPIRIGLSTVMPPD